MRTVKTPALTTATVCSRALTGIGATIAPGSQEWNGIRAVLAVPKKKSRVNSVNCPLVTLPARIPPAEKSRVPVSSHVQMIAVRRKKVEVPRSIPR